jgi:hypothetical protein
MPEAIHSHRESKQTDRCKHKRTIERLLGEQRFKTRKQITWVEFRANSELSKKGVYMYFGGCGEGRTRQEKKETKGWQIAEK